MSKVTTGAPALLLVVVACAPAAAQISVIGGEARGLVKRSHVVEFFSGAPTLEWPEQAFCEVVDFEPGRRAAVGGPDPGHVTLDPYAGVSGCPWFAIPTDSGMAIGQRGVLRFDSLLDVGRWSLLCQADFRQVVADDCAPLPCGFACDLESDNPIVFWMEVEVFNDAPSMTVSASSGTWGSPARVWADNVRDPDGGRPEVVVLAVTRPPGGGASFVPEPTAAAWTLTPREHEDIGLWQATLGVVDDEGRADRSVQ